MIRSLVAPHTVLDGEAFVLRRNLMQDKIEAAYEDGDIVWLDVVEPDGNEIDWVGRFFKFSPSVMEDLYRVDRRPSLLVYPSYIFLSLVQPHVKKLKIEGAEIHCIIGERFLITVRGPNTSAVETAYDRAAQDTGIWLKGLPYFLYLICQDTVDSYYPLLDRMSNHLNRIEEQLMTDVEHIKEPRQAVYNIKQQLISLRQMIAPQREVLSNMLGEARFIEEAVRDLFRHLYERLLRVYDLIDAQRDLSSSVLDMMENQESKHMADAVNRLTIFSMIFLPLTFLCGLFELNFVIIPDPLALPFPGRMMFAVVVILMITSAVGMYLYLRRRGWL
jgi:magnesium transporter